jgi:cytoskeleton protein RodZ
MNDPAAPGARLRAEREHRGLSAQKAADEMHLDRWVIDALETDDYQRIGPAVYAKGHLKKYAALLGLPAAEIAAGYDSHAHAPAENASAGPSMLLSSRNEPPVMSNFSPAQMAGFVLAALLLIGLLWWKPWHQRGGDRLSAPAASSTAKAQSEDSSSGAPAAAIADVPVADAAAQAAAKTLDGSALQGVSPVPGTDAAADAAAPLAAAATAGAGYARLRMSFSADSWVDVHDASGKRTYSGNGLANSVKTLAGTAPMRVYLGYGNGVQLTINDRVVAIGSQFFSGDVARFEAGADGVLRRDSRAPPAHAPAGAQLPAPPAGARSP